jgi:hypothetical protein
MRARMFPPPLKPKEYECKQLLKELLRTCKPEEVMPRFMARIQSNLFEYMEF